MSIIFFLFFALLAALTMGMAVSFYIISKALEKKNIKLNLFAFRFHLSERIKGKLARPQTTMIAGTETVTDTENKSIDTQVPLSEPTNTSTELDEQIILTDDSDLEMFDLPEEMDKNLDFLEDIDSGSKTGSRLIGGMRNRLVQAQNDAQAKAIEREERKLQEDLELYDPDETMEEMPDDIRGKFGYWWRNHFGFRIGICASVFFLVFALAFYGFQMRNPVLDNDSNNSTTAIDEVHTEDGKIEMDPELEKFRQSLDDELSPVDVEADSLDEDPNLAEIVITAQRELGATPESYSGSNTVSQPSGSIGTISIPSINLKNAPVMGSVALNDLSKGTGHFENTPVFDGNVGIAGHNNTHFKYLVNVDIGDQIQYTVNGVTRTYQVTDMRAISDTDWGVFTDYGDNRLTLVTCEHLVPNSRIAVTAVQVGSDSGYAIGRVYTGRVNSSFHQDSGDYHDVGSGYTDYIGVFTGNN